MGGAAACTVHAGEMRKLTRGIYNYDPSTARCGPSFDICIVNLPRGSRNCNSPWTEIKFSFLRGDDAFDVMLGARDAREWDVDNIFATKA